MGCLRFSKSLKAEMYFSADYPFFQPTIQEASENQDDEEGPIGKTDKDGSNVEEDDESLSEKGEDSQEPTSWKLLDIKSMKVSELRIELDARKLNSKGLKAQLVARLQEAVTKEQEEETKNQESEQKKNESNNNISQP